MVVFKKKIFKVKKNMRRLYYVLIVIGLVICEKCGVFKRVYRVCLECGDYKGI